MIYKVEKRRFRKEGKLETTRVYYLRYRLGQMPKDRWVSLGVTDKQVAEKKAQEFIREKEREAEGILEPKVVRDAAARPLAEHLEDYLIDLGKRNRAGRSGRGGRQLKMRVATLLSECRWRLAINVTTDSFMAWRSRQSKAARTLNHYLEAMIAFLNWMERMGRIKTNPLRHVAKVDERGQAKRVRRAFADEELRRLVNGSGPRGLVYLVAARTGLRQQELRELIWDDVRLDAAIPCVRVRIACAKNKKEETVPLLPEVVAALKAYRPVDCRMSERVFVSVPQARTLRIDAEKNGIAYQDEFGRYADFHALRYTWGTFLARNGVNQRIAMKLLRHSDIKLTTLIYTDESQLPVYESVKNLPSLGGCAQIRAQIPGETGQNVSQPDATDLSELALQPVEDDGDCRNKSRVVAVGQKTVREGFEPSVAFWTTEL